MKIKKFKKEKRVYEVLHDQFFLVKLVRYIRYLFLDMRKKREEITFNDYGLTCWTGRQGSGKSMSMVERLEQIRRNFPEVTIMTNFGYIYEDAALNDWQQLIDCRNPAGIVFAVDEIQNEFDVYDSRNFNLEILKVITQQRKQGIKILATSQVFTRVSKPLREQCFEVVECHTIGGRWTWQKCFDADDYNMYIDNPNPEKQIKVHRKWRKNFVQSDVIRERYDSYRVIQSMAKLIKQEKAKNKKVVGGGFM